MYEALLYLHNIGRWIVLILLVVSIVKALSGLMGSKPYSNGDKQVALFLMTTAHLMFVVGLYQWIAGPWGLKNIQNIGMKAVMHDTIYRFWAIEHFTGMLIAIILITIGRGAGKKAISDRSKHSRSFWFFLVAFVIILASVPWPFREVARPLFPALG